MAQSAPYAVGRDTPRPRKGRPRGTTTYSKAEIVEAMREWARQYGDPPRSDDLDPARARRQGHSWRAERFLGGTWPSTRMVRHHFRTFGAAVAAAGFDAPRQRRTKPHLSGPDQVLHAIRAWTRRYGEPPAQTDWDVTRARHLEQQWRIDRYNSGDWPSLVTARAHFGTLGNAVRAAGIEPPVRWEPLEERVQRQLRNSMRLVNEAAGSLGASGPGPLADSLRAVVEARQAADDAALGIALLELAEVSTRWAHGLRWVPDDHRPTGATGG